MIRFSFANLLAVAAAITGSADDVTYPASRLAEPERPFLPARTNQGGAQWYLVDFGAAVTLDVIAPIAVNVASLIVQGNATDSWSDPTYSDTLTISRNPWNTRYQRGHRSSSPTLPLPPAPPPGEDDPEPAWLWRWSGGAIMREPDALQAELGRWGWFVEGAPPPPPSSTSFTNLRYLRLSIPAQTPLDEQAVYQLGGVWAGALTAPPRSISWGYKIRRVMPVQDDQPASGAWRQRAEMGEPLTRIEATLRLPDIGLTTAPGQSDALAQWLELERQLLAADAFLVALDDRDVAQTWIMRLVEDPEWTVDKPTAESTLVLEEVVGP